MSDQKENNVLVDSGFCPQCGNKLPCLKHQTEPNKTEKEKPNKRSFEEVLGLFEKARGSKDFFELEKDIMNIVRDFDSVFSKDIREAYPGWTKLDFIKLLRTLGTEYDVYMSGEVPLAQIENDELRFAMYKERNDLLAILQNKRNELEVLAHHSFAYSLPTYEESLERQTALVARLQEQLSKSSLGEKIFSAAARRTRRDIRRGFEEIEELKDLIKQSPLEVRLEKRQRKQDEKEQKIRRLKEEIAEIEKKIAVLDEELNKRYLNG